MERPFRSERLWAFFDSAYRSRVDLDYFAARWKAAGIGAARGRLAFLGADPQQDAYLAKLIAACHRDGILVYAWLELPHVSEKFWADHPRVARKDRHLAGCPARLAQADEPDQSRRFREVSGERRD
jgi:hypothetical protein